MNKFQYESLIFSLQSRKRTLTRRRPPTCREKGYNGKLTLAGKFSLGPFSSPNSPRYFEILKGRTFAIIIEILTRDGRRVNYKFDRNSRRFAFRRPEIYIRLCFSPRRNHHQRSKWGNSPASTMTELSHYHHLSDNSKGNSSNEE